MSSASPRAFGGYTLLSSLGVGGMGEVFLARRELGPLAKLCVIKTLKETHALNAEYIERFLDEARVVVQLTHKNICQVFDVGKFEGRHYLAMEHVPGATLSALRGSVGGPLPDVISHHIISEVLDALDYAHRHEDPASGEALGIVHRDVSPQNVMISFSGDVKLIDFGLAESRLKVEQTEPHVVLGKIAYMPPEQARGEAVDARCDQFSAAVVAYELFAGERYYDDHDPRAIWAMAGSGTFRPRRLDRLEGTLRAILEQALRPTVDGRFATCAEFRDALEDVRYRDGLRGGREHLRALMEKTFRAERDESRRLLADLTGLPAPVVGEPTLSAAVSLAPTPAGASVQEATAPRARAPIALAIAALALAAGLTAGGLRLASADDGVDAGADASAFLGSASTGGAAHDADRDAGVPADAGAPATNKERLATVAMPSDAGAEATDGGARDAGTRGHARRPIKPIPVPSLAAPGEDATDKERYAFIDQACPAIACRAHSERLDDQRRASGDKREIMAFKRALKECVSACARSR